jgi:hypothetical protein
VRSGERHSAGRPADDEKAGVDTWAFGLRLTVLLAFLIVQDVEEPGSASAFRFEVVACWRFLVDMAHRHAIADLDDVTPRTVHRRGATPYPTGAARGVTIPYGKI